jgi:hypothetical protein
MDAKRVARDKNLRRRESRHDIKLVPEGRVPRLLRSCRREILQGDNLREHKLC